MTLLCGHLHFSAFAKAFCSTFGWRSHRKLILGRQCSGSEMGRWVELTLSLLISTEQCSWPFASAASSAAVPPVACALAGTRAVSCEAVAGEAAAGPEVAAGLARGSVGATLLLFTRGSAGVCSNSERRLAVKGLVPL